MHVHPVTDHRPPARREDGRTWGSAGQKPTVLRVHVHSDSPAMGRPPCMYSTSMTVWPAVELAVIVTPS